MRDHHCHLLHFLCILKINRISSAFALLFWRGFRVPSSCPLWCFIFYLIYPLFVWTVGPNVSLLATFIKNGNFLPIFIISIIVIFRSLLRKSKYICQWGSRYWILVLVLINPLLCIEHIFRVVFIPLGVVILQFLNNSAIYLPVTLKNKFTFPRYCSLAACYKFSLLSGSSISQLPPGYFPSFAISTIA